MKPVVEVCGGRGADKMVVMSKILSTPEFSLDNSIGLYGKSYRCRPEHVHFFVYDLVQLIWPYYRNIMC